MNSVMGPFSITSKKLGEFNFVIGGVPFGNVTSPRSLAPSSGRRFGLKRHQFSRKSSEKGPKNGSDSAKLLREKSYLITSLQQKTAKKGFVDGDKGRTINVIQGREGEANKQTGKGNSK